MANEKESQRMEKYSSGRTFILNGA